MLKGTQTLDYNITYALAKILLGRAYLLTPIAEMIFKMAGVSGMASIMRKFIDNIFNNLGD